MMKVLRETISLSKGIGYHFCFEKTGGENMQTLQAQIAIQKYIPWHHRYQKFIASEEAISISVPTTVSNDQIDPWT